MLAPSKPANQPAAATVHMFSKFITECLDHHGKLHWLRHPEVEETDKILAFDTVSETFRRMSRPPLMDQYGEPYLLEMDRKLAMAAILLGFTQMDLWVLEDYGNDESWARRHRIDLPPTLSRAIWAINASVVGRDNVILLGDQWSESLGLYDLTEKRVLKQVRLAAKDRPFWPCTHMNAHVFKDSLERHAFFEKPTDPAPT
ncbi:hypothetical protein BAE44_0021477 [Dichanthelium oligosanthes]|uniref:F-box associated beta-propeller type 3 domain-containing protein n=1 Tax=Dichanthelium oligosanthes TaxID=888268 RepID=A0A1E5UX93_9POAL|nr:hypothetical protein BAE44_0021477 [Dichanthelium oligosanthes]